jgi:hypothetical protein
MTLLFCTSVGVNIFIILDENGVNISSAISLDTSARFLIKVEFTYCFCKNEKTYFIICISHSFGSCITNIVFLWLCVANLDVKTGYIILSVTLGSWLEILSPLVESLSLLVTLWLIWHSGVIMLWVALHLCLEAKEGSSAILRLVILLEKCITHSDQ